MEKKIICFVDIKILARILYSVEDLKTDKIIYLTTQRWSKYIVYGQNIFFSWSSESFMEYNILTGILMPAKHIIFFSIL